MEIRMNAFGWRPALLALLVGGAVPAGAADLGEQVFQANCAVCHQPQAQGMPGLAPPLKSGQWAALAGVRDYVPSVLLGGMNGSLQLEGGKFMGVMPPMNRLADEQIAAVVNYLFAAVNGQDGWRPLTPAEVGALRENPAPLAALRALRKQAVAP